MALFGLVLILLLSTSLSTNVVYYKFGSNFGQIFYDYSGMGNHGQNGESITSNIKDTIPTDRGAYFGLSTNTYIKLPPNNIKTSSLQLGSTFSIVMWFRPSYVASDTEYYLTKRFKDSNNFLYWKRDEEDKELEVEIDINGSEFEKEFENVSAPNIWSYFVMVVQTNNAKLYTYNEEFRLISLGSTYSETGDYDHYIGYTEDSFKGFVWSYYIYKSEVHYEDYYSNSHTVGNCLVTPCPASCQPAIKENGKSYCISTSSSYSCPSCSYGCLSGLCLDCGSCSNKSCSVISNAVKCLCIDLFGSSCSCTSGTYLSSSSFECEPCYSECLTCTTALKCTTCKDINAIPHDIIGCTCKLNYQNMTALINEGNCIACHSECASCQNETTCLTCKDLNALPDPNIGCICKTKYFNSTALKDGGTCKACHSNCDSCSQSLTCESCIDENAIVHGIVGCICKEGYFNESSLDTQGACLPCFYECKSCESEFLCVACKDSNAYVFETGGCLCNQRFFNSSQVLKDGDCKPCHQDCKTCINGSSCVECIDALALPSSFGCTCSEGHFNSSSTNNLECSQCPSNCSLCSTQTNCTACSYQNMSPLNGVCKCSENSKLLNDSCIADEGYFIDYSPSSGFTSEKCDESCKNCSINKDLCGTCANNLVKDELGRCQTCEFGMFLKDFQCFNCSDDCESCLNSSYCLTCKDPLKEVKNGICLKVCPSYSFLVNNSCTSCSDLCIKCNEKCLECVKNSNLTTNSSCECNKGFKKSKSSCIAKYFKATLKVSSISLATINFTESLNPDLTLNDFKFSVKNRSDLKVTLLKIKKKSEYIFSLNFKNKVKSGTLLQVIITEGLFSVSSSHLKNNLLSDLLPEYSPVSINPSVQVVLNSTTAMTQAAVSSSIGAAIMSNPSAAWALLNSIQILVLLPLNSNNMTKNVRAFLNGFSGYNILPNGLNLIFNEKVTSAPYLEARRYGIETSVFFLNNGKNLSILACTLILYPFVLALSKCTTGRIAAKVIKILGNYRYGFFLRFWTQTVLELLVYGIVQLRSSVVEPVQGYFNQFFATLSVIAAVLTPPLLFVASYVSLSDINSGDEDFQLKWGNLFLEFKNDRGFWSSQYYFLYFSRRVAFALCQVYLNSVLKLQGALNIFFSFLSLGFLIVYRPFKETTILISNMTSEISITFVMILTYCYLWDLSPETSEIIEILIIFSVILAMMIQVMLSLYLFYKSMMIIIKKIEKARSLEFVNRAQKTFPEIAIK